MKDELISFETAKLAKEKGFDELCYSLYKNEKLYSGPFGTTIVNNLYGIRPSVSKFSNSDLKKSNEQSIAAPTQSLLQRWLREVHNCVIEIELHGEEETEWKINPDNFLFEYIVNYYGNPFEFTLSDDNDLCDYNFKSYEEALESALFESLKLIK